MTWELLAFACGFLWILLALTKMALSTKVTRSIMYQSQKFHVKVTDISVSINALGLITNRVALLRLDIGNLELQIQKHRLHVAAKPSLLAQVLTRLFLVVVRKAQVSFRVFNISTNQMSIATSSTFTYWRTDTCQFEIAFGSTTLRISDFVEVLLSPLSISTDCPIQLLTNSSPPFELTMETIALKINGTHISLSSVELSATLAGEKIVMVIPNIDGSMSLSCPELGFYLANARLDSSAVGIVDLSFSNIRIANEDRQLLLIDKFEFTKTVSEVPFLHIHSVILSYDTLSGLAVCPFVVGQVKRYVDLSVGHRIDLRFPNMKAEVQNVRISLMATDNAALDIVSDALHYREHAITGSNIDVEANHAKFLTFKDPVVTADGGLNVSFASIKFEDSHNTALEQFFTEIIWAWSAVAPYIVMHRIASETLPFPVEVKASTLEIEFHDSDLNASLTRASRLIPDIKTDSVIRAFIMRKRLGRLSGHKRLSEEAYKQLDELEFSEFRKNVNATSKHKSSFAIVFDNVSVSLDSRNFAEKISMIHAWDPSTKILYPNMQWEALLGFRVDAFADEMKLTAFDIKIPLSKAIRPRVQGPVIIAEPKAPQWPLHTITVCNVPVKVSKNPMKLRIYGDMTISSTDFYYYTGACYQPVYEELSRMLLQVIPHGIDPSPKLVWFDMYRMQTRGQFLFKTNVFEARFPGTSSYRDCDNYMPIRLYNFSLITREGECTVTADRWSSPRVCDNKEVIFFDMKSINWSFKFHWKTSNSAHCREHITFPDVSKFGDPQYDTYEHFRATEIVISDSILSFNGISNLSVDFAQLWWIISPIVQFVKSSEVKGMKFGVAGMSKLKVKRLSDLTQTWHLQIIGGTVVARVFGYLPEVHGSSLDLMIRDIRVSLDMCLSSEKRSLKAGLRSSSMSVSIADTAASFISAAPVDISLNNDLKVNIEDVSVHMTPLILKYIVGHVIAPGARFGVFQSSLSIASIKILFTGGYMQFTANLTGGAVTLNGGKIETNVSKFDAVVSSDGVCLELENDDIGVTFLKQRDGSMELGVILGSLRLTNATPGTPYFRDVMQLCQQCRTRPHIRVELRMPPHTNTDYVFSQVEVNVEPTVLAYDAHFWETASASFKREMHFLQEKEVMEHHKSNQPIVIMRYFRLNPVSVNFSYRNSCNKIFSEINNFQGQINEIIYRNISSSGLITHVLRDVALNMIPQFLKHCVGLKQPDITPEEAIEEWLNDDQTMTTTEKQKILLFGKK